MKNIIAIITALFFILNAVILLSANVNNNKSKFLNDTSYEFTIGISFSITGLQLKNNYLSVLEYVYQNNVLQLNPEYTFYTTNSTFDYLYENDTGLSFVNANGYAFNIYNSYSYGSSSNAITTFKFIVNVYPNSYIAVNPSSNGMPTVQPNEYITPQGISYNISVFAGEFSVLSENINYYNNINKLPAEPIGLIKFISNQTYTLIIDNETYVNIKNFTIALPLGTYNYIAYNKTNFYSNGTATVIQTNILQYPIQFSSINFAINYIFITFILIITIISLIISYLLARNYYAFFTAEIFFLFIGYSAGIPYISITIFALALFFMVFIIVYKVILE